MRVGFRPLHFTQCIVGVCTYVTTFHVQYHVLQDKDNADNIRYECLCFLPRSIIALHQLVLHRSVFHPLFFSFHHFSNICQTNDSRESRVTFVTPIHSHATNVLFNNFTWERVIHTHTHTDFPTTVYRCARSFSSHATKSFHKGGFSTPKQRTRFSKIDKWNKKKTRKGEKKTTHNDGQKSEVNIHSDPFRVCTCMRQTDTHTKTYLLLSAQVTHA